MQGKLLDLRHEQLMMVQLTGMKKNEKGAVWFSGEEGADAGVWDEAGEYRGSKMAVWCWRYLRLTRGNRPYPLVELAQQLAQLVPATTYSLRWVGNDIRMKEWKDDVDGILFCYILNCHQMLPHHTQGAQKDTD